MTGFVLQGHKYPQKTTQNILAAVCDAPVWSAQVNITPGFCS